jgi:cholesterol oxidase
MAEYDAIVVGSGFGATVAVSHLAERAKKVLMLERGTWWQSPQHLGVPPTGGPPPLPEWASAQDPPHPVQYWPRPDHEEGLIDLFASVRHRHNRDGLYVYSRFDECDIVSASGVGGGSLIYSNATLQPDPDVLQQIGLDLTDDDYAAALEWTTDRRGVLNKVITKIPLPKSRDVMNLAAEDYLYLDRARVHRKAAAAVSQKRGIDPPAAWTPLDLAIAEYHEDGDGNTDVNKRHTFCERQGRCVLGCLPQARHTLNKTLYRAWLSDPAKGVELRPLSEVRYVTKVDGGYAVTYRDHWTAEGDERTVSAPTVFLGAGTLGTNEILLRSREQGLALSDEVGQGFSTNGNFGGFCVDTADVVQSTRGPINTCHADFQLSSGQIMIEDCAIPSMFAPIASTAVNIIDGLEQGGGFFGWAHRVLFETKMRAAWAAKAIPDLQAFLPHIPDTYKPDDSRTEAEAVDNIFFFNCMGQDQAHGRFRLDDDELDLTWDDRVADQPVFGEIEDLLRDFSEAMGGRYVPMPTWKHFGDRKLTVTHPLGGCRVGADRDHGVVNAVGRVFDQSADDPQATHDGLFIVDASVFPGAVVAHPTMTIMAQALKTMKAALP